MNKQHLQGLYGLSRLQRLLAAWLLTLAIMISPLTVSLTQAQGTLTGQASQAHVVTYPAAEQHANAIINRLEAANGLSADTVNGVRVIQAEDLNAATNGQQIVVSSALWNLLRTDDQKAFVLSHELSHVVLNHIPKTQVRQIGFGLLDALLQRRLASANNAVTSQLLQLATDAGLQLVDLRFSRQAEYQADERGIQLMDRAGYNPQAAVQVFNIFEQHSPSSTPEFLRSHPMNRSRIEALARKYGSTAFLTTRRR